MEKENKNNVKIEISQGKMILKLLTAYIISNIGVSLVIGVIIFLMLYITNNLDIGLNYIEIFVIIISYIISSLIAIKFVSKKYILKEKIEDFINKITIFIIVCICLFTSFNTYFKYKDVLLKIKLCDTAKIGYENARETGTEIKPFKEDCKTIDESIEAIEDEKRIHIFDGLVLPVISSNLLLLSQIIILNIYAKKKLVL